MRVPGARGVPRSISSRTRSVASLERLSCSAIAPFIAGTSHSMFVIGDNAASACGMRSGASRERACAKPTITVLIDRSAVFAAQAPARQQVCCSTPGRATRSVGAK